jgi:hypothetical protein
MDIQALLSTPELNRFIEIPNSQASSEGLSTPTSQASTLSYNPDFEGPLV